MFVQFVSFKFRKVKVFDGFYGERDLLVGPSLPEKRLGSIKRPRKFFLNLRKVIKERLELTRVPRGVSIKYIKGTLKFLNKHLLKSILYKLIPPRVIRSMYPSLRLCFFHFPAFERYPTK